MVSILIPYLQPLIFSSYLASKIYMAEFNFKTALFGLHSISLYFQEITFYCGYERKYFSYMYIKHPVIVYTLK